MNVYSQQLLFWVFDRIYKIKEQTAIFKRNMNEKKTELAATILENEEKTTTNAIKKGKFIQIFSFPVP